MYHKLIMNKITGKDSGCTQGIYDLLEGDMKKPKNYRRVAKGDSCTTCEQFK